jgi:alpha-amylase
MILLRGQGYPCVFWGDLYGCGGNNPQQAVSSLSTFIKARNLFSYGETRDYWDHPNCVGWVRVGDDFHDGCAVVLSNGDEGYVRPPPHPNPYPLNVVRWKHMEVGREHAGEEWTDLLGWYQGVVKIAEDGWGVFRCHGESVSIWVKLGARGRDGS